MSVNQDQKLRRGRAALCAGLIALLAASGYAGASRPVPAACVPVSVQMVPADALSAQSTQDTAQKLRAAREKSLMQLQSVIDHPGAEMDAVQQALAEKTRIAANMEKEAALCAALAYMGMSPCAAVLSADAVTVVVPWQIGENEHSRVQIIDAAVTQTGLDAGEVKIILAKK